MQRHPASRIPLRTMPFAVFKRCQGRYIPPAKAACVLGLEYMALKKALVAHGIETVFDLSTR